jgi:hypothetical protein
MFIKMVKPAPVRVMIQAHDTPPDDNYTKKMTFFKGEAVRFHPFQAQPNFFCLEPIIV